MIFGLVGPTYQGLSLKFDTERSINLFPERIESGQGKDGAQFALIGTPGLEVFSTLADGPVRGLVTVPAIFPDSKDRVFAVGGASLYEILSTGAANLIDSVRNDKLPVYFATNGNQVAIASGKRLYILNLSDGTLTGPSRDSENNLITAASVVFLDGFFIVADEDGKIRYSALNDGLVWDALDYVTAETVPDRILALLVDHEDLIVFGTASIQFFYNSGDADNPIVPRTSATVQMGLVGAATVARLDNAVVFIGRDPQAGGAMAYRLNGYTPQRISNHAVEWSWQSYPQLDDAWSYAFVEGGHTFWHLNFPAADRSWRFDAATGMWHEPLFWNVRTGAYEQHLTRTHTAAFGGHLAGNRP